MEIKNSYNFLVRFLRKKEFSKKEASKKKANTQKGQLTIFLGISLTIVLTMMAFIINVGLFVKAKINLQNAVDSAAWSGAAVQARQLTNIAYLNWEMRNNYKEWMFKYYILGQLGLTKTRVENKVVSQAQVANTMSFRMDPFFEFGDVRNPAGNNFDPFNAPSICIHFGSPNNICEIYRIPGLPRFNTVGLPSISEQQEAFLNSLVATKSKDCSVRSDLNFGTAILWVYGIGKEIPGAPAIAAQRVGAWPMAIELALRMRNLEAIVNRPPVASPICISGQNDCVGVQSIDESTPEGFQINERPSKAFFSAFANLGGGQDKENGEDLLSNSFQLTELPPKPLDVSDGENLSNFLIPQDATIAGASARVKHYLDLQVYPLNLVTFFTSFVSSTEQFQDNASVQAEGECGGTKTALPVPGFMFGFVKNPAIMTYYAVKGEANFRGMFFPFQNANEGIKLTTYAAAKPFGGRIGPRLFGINGSGESVTARKESSQSRSAPYISGLEPITTPFQVGFPIPTDPDFWVRNENDVIGGVPTGNAKLKFAIPNLLYDYENFSDIQLQGGTAKVLLTLNKAASGPDSLQIKEDLGLYDKKQFASFADNLEALDPLQITAEEVQSGIDRVRRPTNYEALNYLIPTMSTNIVEEDNLDTIPYGFNINQNAGGVPQYKIYAPLFGEGTLYANVPALKGLIDNFLRSNRVAVKVFTDALKAVADDMIAKETTGNDSFRDAAETIFKEPLALNGNTVCSKISIAGKFHQLFNGSNTVCGIPPLFLSMEEYFNDRSNDNDPGNEYQFFFKGSYTALPQGLTNQTMSSGYTPGKRQGSDEQDSTTNHPFPDVVTNAPLSGKRNYYSTKFIALDKIVEGGNDDFYSTPVYMESDQLGTAPTDLQPGELSNQNFLSRGDLSEFSKLTR
jgi:hypothetical protein